MVPDGKKSLSLFIQLNNGIMWSGCIDECRFIPVRASQGSIPNIFMLLALVHLSSPKFTINAFRHDFEMLYAA